MEQWNQRFGDCCRLAAAIRFPFWKSVFCRYAVCVMGVLMKTASAVLIGAFLLASCSQAIDQLYSKKNFTAQSFNADISECKHQNPSFVAVQSYGAESRDRQMQVDDAMVRECMKGKGYTVQIETMSRP
jgi:hypothetical protein